MPKPNQGVKILCFTWMPGWARSKATTWSWLFSTATIRQVMFRSPVVFGSVPASRACLASLSFPSLQFFHRFWWRFIANSGEALFSNCGTLRPIRLVGVTSCGPTTGFGQKPHLNQSVLRCFPSKALQLSPLPPPFIRLLVMSFQPKNRFSIVNQI